MPNFKKLCFFILLTSFVNITFAQVTVNKNVTATQLAQAMVGPNVIISNATLNCNVDAFGLFTATPSCNLNITNGILLATGDANNSIGPNAQAGITTDFLGAGDADLNLLIAPTLTHDACALEFDVFVMGTSISFNYVFASDEYEEFANGGINDAFALFISGPGIPGLVSMSTVPTTTSYVSINTINCTVNGQYYVCNSVNTVGVGGVCTAANCPTNNANALCEYDGFTTKLTANSPTLIPCNTYHLKLVIADGSDGILDSGIFLEGGSLIINGINIKPIIGVNNSYPNLVEGCIDGHIEMKRVCDTIDTMVVHIAFDSTAQLGVHYNAILNNAINLHNIDSIIFLPGDTLNLININTIDDNIADSLKYITIYVDYVFAGDTIYDSVTVMLQSRILVDAPPDTFICENKSFTVKAKGWGYTPNATYQWNWSPSTNIVSGANTGSPIFNFSNNTNNIQTYKIYVGINDIAICPALDSFYITIKPEPIANFTVSTNDSICTNNILTVTDASTVDNLGPIANYNWNWGIGQSNANTGSGPFSIFMYNGGSSNVNTNFTLQITQNGCVSPAKTIPIVVFPKPIVVLTGKDSICFGEYITIKSTPIYPTIVWNTGATADSLVTNYQGIYKIFITDLNGCKDTADFNLYVKPSPVADAGPDQFIYEGETVTLNASNSINADQYIWMPINQVDNAQAMITSSTPQTTQNYVLIVKDKKLNCVDYDTCTVFVNPCRALNIPNAFTPNNDGNDDYFVYMNPEDIYALIAFEVYDRWGQRVFYSNDKFTKGWDGKIKDEPAEVGTYVYQIIAQCGSPKKIIKIKGDVTLIK